jgi:hypothetical protein
MSEKQIDWSRAASMVATEEGLLVTERGEDGQVGLAPFLFSVPSRASAQVVVRNALPQHLLFARPSWLTPTWVGPEWVKLYIAGNYVGDVWKEAAKWLQDLEAAHIVGQPGKPQIAWLNA